MVFVGMTILSDEVTNKLKAFKQKLSKRHPDIKVTYSLIVQAALAQFEAGGCKIGRRKPSR